MPIYSLAVKLNVENLEIREELKMEVAIKACTGIATDNDSNRIIALHDSDLQVRLDEFKKQGSKL